MLAFNASFPLKYVVGPDQYGIFRAHADTVTDIKEYENSDIQYICLYSIYNILDEVIKYVWQRYVMEAGFLANFILNIRALNSKHFSYY